MKTNGRKRSLTHSLNVNAVSRNGESAKRKRLTLSESDKHKKIYTLDDFLEIMKPSEEELKYREKECENINAIEKYSKLFRCTKCHMSFKSIIENHEEVPTHPCLNVLMCQQCCSYYLDGEFSVDSEGEEKYCRWCGEGGAILGCSICVSGFCAKCIKRHWNNKFLKKIKMNDNWICFLCDSKPLWKHRLICSLAVSASKNENTPKLSSELKDSKGNEEKSLNSICSSPSSSTDDYMLQATINKERKNSKNLNISCSSDELLEIAGSPSKKLKCSRSSQITFDKNETDPFENKKSDALIELAKVLKLSESHMDFGKACAAKMLKNLTGPDFEGTSKELVTKCQKIKQFLSLISTYLVQFSNSVDSIERSLQNDFEQKNSNFLENDQLSFNTILQFLGFVNNQVKIFIEKGITLSDILEPEVYDDGNVVGIKKKSASSNIYSNENANANSDVESEKTGANSDNESKDITEDKNDECEDTSKTEINPDFISSQNTETNFTEVSDEQKESNNFNLTIDEKSAETREEIQEILAILENA